MKKIEQPLRIIYDALSAFHSTRILSGSERQVYDANTMYFNPDRRLDPLTILVETGVNDPHGFVNGLVNGNLTDVVWKISVAGVLTTILETDAEFKIGKNAEKGKLTIYKNIPDTEEVTITFSAKYLQAVGKRVANFQTTFTLVTASEALAPAIIELTAPYGEILYPFKNKNKGLVAEANLVRETENVAGAYWWYKDGIAVTDINGFQNSTTNKLFVPASQVGKKGTIFSVEVADCSVYLQQLRNEWIDANNEVMQWRNLYQTESENLFSMNTIKGAFSFEDKIIVFKANDYNGVDLNGNGTQYQAGSYVLNGFVRDITSSNARFVVRYLDGSTSGNLFNANLPYTSDPLKTIEKILLAYSIGGSVEIKELKISKNEGEIGLWSPSKSDLEALISQKQTEAKAAVSLPVGYRPIPKPTKLFKKEIVFIKRFGKYNLELMVPSPIPADATVIHAELIVTNNQGIIESPENYFKAGWFKKTNGSYTYEGFVQNIPIDVLQQFIAEGKGWDVEIDEL